MRTIIAAGVVLLLGACATGGANVKGPNGRPMYHIETVGVANGYAKASEKCPNGYDVITTRQQGLFAILDIECK